MLILRIGETGMKVLLLCLAILSVNCICCAESRISLSVLGFVNRAIITNANNEPIESFTITKDFLIEELASSEKFMVVENEHNQYENTLGKTIQELEQGKGFRLLNSFQAKYIVYGFLTNLNIKSSTSSFNDKSVGVYRHKETVYVNLCAKVLERASGRIVLVVTGKGDSTKNHKISGKYGGESLFFGGKRMREESIHDALSRAVHDIARKIISKA